jgi:hypothetical protein
MISLAGALVMPGPGLAIAALEAMPRQHHPPFIGLSARTGTGTGGGESIWP